MSFFRNKNSPFTVKRLAPVWSEPQNPFQSVFGNAALPPQAFVGSESDEAECNQPLNGMGSKTRKHLPICERHSDVGQFPDGNVIPPLSTPAKWEVKICGKMHSNIPNRKPAPRLKCLHLFKTFSGPAPKTKVRRPRWLADLGHVPQVRH
jgi:hypothetical protein